MTLVATVHDFCRAHGFAKTYWVALSGGLDSHVLLALCIEIRKQHPIQLRAIHINHGINEQAKNWALHCAQLCKDYEVDYIERSVQIDPTKGDSIEELARKQRYAVFAEYIQDDDILLTAHQQDDQAETVLLQLLRGAGLKGLAAMPAIKPFARGFHGRPLLSVSRRQLQDYAKVHGLTWINDDSNNNIKLTRNFIRHEIVPLLKNRWPTLATTISRTADHCAQAQTLLEEFVKEEWERIKGSKDNTLSVSKLLQLPETKQKLLLRMWIQKLGYVMPNTKKINSMLRDVLQADWDRQPLVCWQQISLRRFGDDLYLIEQSTHDPTQVLSWQLTQPLTIAGLGTLCAATVIGRGLRRDIPQVDVKFRQGGEKIYLAGRGRRTLKNLFQEWRVPVWMRERVPFIFIEDRLIAVVGYFIDENYAAKGDEQGYDLQLVNPSIEEGLVFEH